ncbi:ATPase RavA [Thalassocella blandensis]|nr:ATPase RavA [Thalassocella blandensis]
MTDIPPNPNTGSEDNSAVSATATATAAPDSGQRKVAEASAQLATLAERINLALIGQEEVVKQVIITMLAGGHVLLEGVPGLGKTLLVRILANAFAGTFKRIQFTPDLMPSDVTGHALFDMKEGKFRVRQGPVFTNILLADEINRAPAKTQAALLEVMQEKRVTIEGRSHPVPLPFMVLATQNPLDQEGTYPLPEAELDRFLMKVLIDYPSEAHEVQLTQLVTSNTTDDTLKTDQSPLMNAEQVQQLQSAINQITIDEQVVDYAVRLVRATRNSTAIRQGAGPRASIALVRCAKVNAVMEGRDFVLPDDIKAVALPVMRHRIVLSADAEIDGVDADEMLQTLLEKVDAPRL